MKVPTQVKDGDLRKKSDDAFVFDSSNISDKKGGGRVVSWGKENVASGSIKGKNTCNGC